MTLDFNTNDRYDKIQRLQKVNGYTPDEPSAVTKITARAIILIFGVALGMIVISAARSCEPKPETGQLDCGECHNRQAAMTQYFKKNGSKTPEQMALAVLSTKNPRLMAAIAKVESNGNPQIRRAGYKKRHDGAFQVNGRIHGRVSHDVVEQALQSERILTELTAEYGIKKALSVYGGDSTSRYQKTVLAELVNVP